MGVGRREPYPGRVWSPRGTSGSSPSGEPPSRGVPVSPSRGTGGRGLSPDVLTTGRSPTVPSRLRTPTASSPFLSSTGIPSTDGTVVLFGIRPDGGLVGYRKETLSLVPSNVPFSLPRVDWGIRWWCRRNRHGHYRSTTTFSGLHAARRQSSHFSLSPMAGRSGLAARTRRRSDMSWRRGDGSLSSIDGRTW